MRRVRSRLLCQQNCRRRDQTANFDRFVALSSAQCQIRAVLINSALRGLWSDNTNEFRRYADIGWRPEICSKVQHSSLIFKIQGDARYRR